MQRVIVIGGGTGGTMLANALDRRRFDVTMISDSLYHVFQPALLYVAFANASPTIVRDERRLLSSDVSLVKERVSAVDLQHRVVSTSDGSNYTYDRLVVATGIHTDPSQIPGLAAVNAQFGDYHSTIGQAQKLRGQLERFTGGTIAVGQTSPICKCPPSPIEGVLLVDRLLRRRGLRDRTRLIFFTPYPRAYPAEAMNETVEPILEERGIECLTFFDVDKIDVETRTITSIEGDSIVYDLPILIPPFAGAQIAYTPPTVIDENGFVIADKRNLNVVGFEDAFAIGDATNAPTAKSGVTAHLQAKVVARRLAGLVAAFDGRTNCPMDLADGRGTFVIGSYATPVVKYRPSRASHLMKAAMAKIYWLSLRGVLEPIFDLYFQMTNPDRRIGFRRP
jgi:sulfide:quinone oxidoreductase